MIALGMLLAVSLTAPPRQEDASLLAEAIAQLTAKIAPVLGLAPDQPPASVLLGDEPFAQRYQDWMSERNGRSWAVSLRLLLQHLDCLAPDDESPPAAFFDERTRQVVCSERTLDRKGKQALVRAVALGLRDRQTTLDEFASADESDLDRSLARLLVVEGEAQLAVSCVEGRDPSQRNALGLTRGESSPDGKLAPSDLIVRSRGQDFFQALRDRKLSFDHVYASAPRSTEEVLHPSRHLAADDSPVGITPPDLACVLEKDFERLDGNRAGELLIWQWGAANLGNTEQALGASMGWAGDRYELWVERASRRTLLIWWTTWDSRRDAREFFELASRTLHDGHYWWDDHPGEDLAQSWLLDGPFGYSFVERRQRDVLIIDGPLIDRESVERLARAAWQFTKSGVRVPGRQEGELTAADRRVSELISRIEVRLQDLRGLAFKTEPVVSFIDREDVADEDTRFPGDTPARVLWMRHMGLLGSPPAGSAAPRPGVKVGGFYDDKAKKLFCISSEYAGHQYATMVHELMHALQDQHKDLRPFRIEAADRDDESSARTAVIEGEAQLVVELYLNEFAPIIKTEQPALPSIVSASRLHDRERLRQQRPPAADLYTMYPYEIGLDFARALYESEGWGGIDRAFAEPPESTEQILHPEKFLAGDDPPREVTLADLADVLGEDWESIAQNQVGEYMIWLWALSLGKDVDRAEQGSRGWGGDSYRLYRHRQSGQTLLCWRTTWDSETDAREFFDLAAATFAARHHVDAPTTDDARSLVDLSSPATGNSQIQRREKDVLVLDAQASLGQDVLDALADAMWR